MQKVPVVKFHKLGQACHYIPLVSHPEVYHSSHLFTHTRRQRDIQDSSADNIPLTPHSHPLVLASSEKLGGSVGTILHKETESYLINVRRKYLGTLVQSFAHLLVIFPYLLYRKAMKLGGARERDYIRRQRSIHPI